MEVPVQAVEGTSLLLDVCHFSGWLLKSRDEITIENLLCQFLAIKTNSSISLNLGARALCPGASMQSMVELHRPQHNQALQPGHPSASKLVMAAVCHCPVQ